MMRVTSCQVLPVPAEACTQALCAGSVGDNSLGMAAHSILCGVAGGKPDPGQPMRVAVSGQAFYEKKFRRAGPDPDAVCTGEGPRAAKPMTGQSYFSGTRSDPVR